MKPDRSKYLADPQELKIIDGQFNSLRQTYINIKDNKKPKRRPGYSMPPLEVYKNRLRQGKGFGSEKLRTMTKLPKPLFKPVSVKINTSSGMFPTE